jgi:hypothetical protein
MNFQFYVEKLLDSKTFQEFTKQNKEAYPCSAFFVIDLEGKDNKQHFDYFLPKTKKLFSIKLENNSEIVAIETADQRIQEKISLKIDFDLKDMQDLIQKEMEKNKITNKIQKMLFSLQRIEGRDLLIGTVFITMMGILTVHIDINKKEMIFFEKKSFFDMIKVVKKKDE